MNKMFVEERRQKILSILNEKKRTTIQELAKHIQVSDATIRNDLAKLEKQQLIKRTHGGAIALDYFNQDTLLTKRQSSNILEKEQIAKHALSFIEEGDSIMLDASTTVFELAKLLVFENKRLTVITNGITTALELNKNPLITVILIGGIIQKSAPILEGSIGVDVLSKMNISKFFVSANGFTLVNGLQDFSFYEVELKKAMIKNSKRVIALLDYSKINKNSISSFASIEEIDNIICNKKLDNKTINLLKQSLVKTQLDFI